jgi:hypothetical protein
MNFYADEGVKFHSCDDIRAHVSRVRSVFHPLLAIIPFTPCPFPFLRVKA